MNKSLKFLSLALLVFTVISCGSKSSTEKSSSQEAVTSLKKPNIIYILADDLGYGDLSSYGQTMFKTPNIDKLVTEGLMFTQHYAGNTVCAPSRSALLTGQHTGHTPVRGNKEIMPEGQYPIPASTFTLAESLKKGGYVTGAFGKWGLGFPGSEGDPVYQGFDTFYGYNCQRLGHNYYPNHLWSNRDSIALTGNDNGQKGQYAPILIQAEAIKFLEKNKDTTFFMYVPTIIPHAELAAPEHIIEKYRGKYLPEKKFKGTDDGPEFRLGKYESQDESHAAFVAMIEVMDTQVGEIMDKVKALGIEDNTIIVFASDNGPHEEGGADPKFFNSAGPLRGVKRDLYEGGIRVPMTIKWPNKIKAGTQTDLISAFWDVFPTFSEIAGVEVPEGLDGISFLPTLLDKPEDQVQHDYLYWEFHERGGRQAIRKGDWKAVKYNVLKKPNAPMQLFDLSTDMGEKNNIAAQHPEIVAQMKALFLEARTPSDVFTFDQVSF